MRFFAVLLGLSLALSLAAETPPLPDDPSPLVGSNLTEALAAFGAPTAVRPARGPEPWQDDVIFVYAGGVSCHWYVDRLWRITFEAPYAAPVFGLFLGDRTDKAVSLLGQPWASSETVLVWRLPWKGYPMALSALLKDGLISSLAVYRSDL